MYTIGQVSERFDLPVSTLRYYDKEGLFPALTRTSGIRRFGEQEIEAEVPMAEAGDYATFLRSLTQGRGYFRIAFERYEEAPANVAQKVIEQYKVADED